MDVVLNLEYALELKKICKVFDGRKILNNLDLSVKHGERLAIVGRSGSGKSVALKIACGLFQADSGEIVICGSTVSTSDRADYMTITKKISFLFQANALFDSLSVWENIVFGLIFKPNKPVSRKIAKEIAYGYIEKMGLPKETGELLPAYLSGGMKKRVALARALTAEPDILILDEPATGLDRETTTSMEQLIEDVRSEKPNLSVINVTHDSISAIMGSDKISVIFRGENIWSGPPAEIYNCNDDRILPLFPPKKYINI